MNAGTAVLTLDDMMNFTRRHRDRYLDALAAEPLFSGVARHHLPIVGRAVEVLDLAPGHDLHCVPARETIFVTAGYALVIDADHRPVAGIGPGAVIGGQSLDRGVAPERVLAITELRGFVVARRELAALAAVAPRVADLANRRTSVTQPRYARLRHAGSKEPTGDRSS